jgi:dipeptidyl aminopeptidase/acylaminoacyl peptidase
MPHSGRHLYARGPRRSRLIVGALVVAVAAGGVAAAMFLPSWLRSRSADTTPTPTAEALTCPSARLAGDAHLGSVAWVDDGDLHLLDLDTCEERTLVEGGATPPVRFSQDGRWIAFGDGAIVPAVGGEVQRPVGQLNTWQWSPTNDVLAGVSAGGAVVVGGPEADRRILLEDGSDAGHVAFSPDGRSLGVDIGGDRVAVVDVVDGATITVYRVSPRTKAPPQVVGWSPDGRWVLFFSRFLGQAGVPLNTAPADGGDWVNVFDPVLPYDDFLSWCGGRLALSGGGEQAPSEGNQILVSGPPDWQYDNLSNDFSRSWIWPACSPNGRWIVATATPNHSEEPPGRGIRALWVLSIDGAHRSRLTGPGNAAYEAARWSADGRFLLVVRRGLEPSSTGALLLYRFDPSTGTAKRAAGPVARVGAAPGEHGHTDWSNTIDWYRPSHS